MIRRPPRSTRTDTLFPYTTLFRSAGHSLARLHGLVRHEAGVRVVPAQPALGLAEEMHRRVPAAGVGDQVRSEEHTSELQSLMRISYAVFCLKKKKTTTHNKINHNVHKPHTEQDSKLHMQRDL